MQVTESSPEITAFVLNIFIPITSRLFSGASVAIPRTSSVFKCVSITRFVHAKWQSGVFHSSVRIWGCSGCNGYYGYMCECAKCGLFFCTGRPDSRHTLKTWEDRATTTTMFAITVEQRRMDMNIKSLSYCILRTSRTYTFVFATNNNLCLVQPQSNQSMLSWHIESIFAGRLLSIRVFGAICGSNADETESQTDIF